MNKDNIGFEGEEKAANFLKNDEYIIIDRNFMCNFGEIDIIARDLKTNEIVFVEVKTRTNNKYGKPIDSVDTYKIIHILKSANYYIYINNIEKEYIRFDIIEVYFKENEIKINHVKNILM